jgi:hypothetical protein
LVFERYVRHGEYVLRAFDRDLVEMHQIIFMEVVGFKVDAHFIGSFLQKHMIPCKRVGEPVKNFMTSFKQYIWKEQCKMLLKSDNPVDCFEAELNKKMGKDKVVRGFQKIFVKSLPSLASLELLIERKIF